MKIECEENDSGIENRELTESAEERTPTPSNNAPFLTSKSTSFAAGHQYDNKIQKSNRGRIMISIRNSAPAFSSSTLLSSESIQIGGLHWRLQIINNRNPLTGRCRFISLFIHCDDLLFGDTLTTVIKFRLISQIKRSDGIEEEIIGKFDQLRRHAGIYNFYEFGTIFREGSEFICEKSNMAQIEAQIRIISREREHHICRIDHLLFQYSPQQLSQSTPKQSIWRQKRIKYALDLIRKNEEKETSGSKNEISKQRNEGKINSTKIGKNALKKELNSVEKNGNKSNENEQKMAIIKMDDQQWAKRRKRSSSVDRQKGGPNITDYFPPCRRSSRIPAQLCKNILQSDFETQVKMAANEHFLEIFKSPQKGRGLRAKKFFKKGEFVVEYKGDVLNIEQAKKREMDYAKNAKIGCYMFFFKFNDTNWCIDATKECASKGRLVNHSKLAPNMKAKVYDLGDEYPHLCLIAMRDIQIGEELTFDYGDRTPLTLEKNPWLLNT